MTANTSGRRSRALSRRRLLALATAGLGWLAGCGYRPGGGDVRWEFSTGTGPYRPDDVLAAGGTLFVVNRSRRGYDFETEEWGESAEVAAYDPSTGSERWEATTPSCGRPAVNGGTLYLGHEDGGLTALDADGTTRWQVSTDAFPRWLAASDDRVYALTDAGDLSAFDATDGEGAWQISVGSGNGSALTATEDGVVVHYGAGAVATTVAAIRRDGEQRWSAEVADDLGDGRPVVAGEAVYVPTDRTLVALSLRDGEERWSQAVGRLRGSPAVGDDAVYHVAGRTLYVRNPEDGEVQWQFEPPTRGGFSAPPTVAGGSVYAAGREALYALARADGSVRWQVESGASAAPLVVGRTVVATNDGSVRGHWRE